MLTFVLWSLTMWSLQGQLPIQEARLLGEGNMVTVAGVVTNGDELGLIRYLQDAGGGLALYPGTGSAPGFDGVQRGDSLLVTGMLVDYFGLLELNPITSFTIIESGRPLPEPIEATPAELDESLEGCLLRLICSNVDSPNGLLLGGQEYLLQHFSGEEFDLYLPTGHPLSGSPAPTEAIDLVGILSQSGNYQLLPRDADDLQPSACLYFSSPPVLSDQQSDGFQLQWQTSNPAGSMLRYGPTPELDFAVVAPALSTEHILSIDGLDPATFYYVQAVSFAGIDTVRSAVELVTTTSTSSGAIEVYFNQWTDPAYSTGQTPAGSDADAAAQAIQERIEAAQTSIEVCMYNANLLSWRDWLVDAHGRGVQVRYIHDDETNNTALSGGVPFPTVAGNIGSGLMHNKFLVIDADSPEDAYVLTGSMNMTSNGVYDDYNNLLVIQDQALAKAFRLEFEEMWGSTGLQPDPAQARFGEEKTDNTPHLFQIGGMPVECYFSPSDGAEAVVLDALESADESIEAALLILTRNDLAVAMKDAHFAGKRVRAIIEQTDSPGSDFQFLQSQGVLVQDHPEFGQFHHKYGIVDANFPDLQPVVVTGSYNWTQAASTVNDEALLVFRDAGMANLFLQEFEARWSEVTSVYERDFPGTLGRVFPNPATDRCRIELSTEREGEWRWQLVDLLGRTIAAEKATLPAGDHQLEVRWAGAAPGLYWLELSAAGGRLCRPLAIVR